MAQRVLVTAGGSGIGREIALAFAETAAAVWVCDISEAHVQDVISQNDQISGSVCDVSDPDAVRAMFDDIDSKLGGLDVLVNNAGVAGPHARIEDIEDRDWAQTIDVNLSGTFWCIRAAAAIMRRQKSGCIINISTTSARTGLLERTPYVASKAALSGLTKNVARELGPDNIRCNSIFPGAVKNERGRQLVQREADKLCVSYEEALEQGLRYVSMRTEIDMREIADLALFLASDGARHISGQEIGVCGNVEWE